MVQSLLALSTNTRSRGGAFVKLLTINTSAAIYSSRSAKSTVAFTRNGTFKAAGANVDGSLVG
jgi:hypothetical protein